MRSLKRLLATVAVERIARRLTARHSPLMIRYVGIRRAEVT
jgi:hypothetical protein